MTILLQNHLRSGRMARVLFINAGSEGHINPTIGVVQEAYFAWRRGSVLYDRVFSRTYREDGSYCTNN